MKRLLSFLIFLSLFAPSAFATPPMLGSLTMDDVEVFSQDNKFGLKDKAGNVLVDADYKKLIRLGKSSWIIQKGSKFGIMDSNGNYLVEPKYRHVDRFFGSYAKLGNDKDYGLYNEKGEIIIVPEYSRIDPLFGQMFLTCKNYKYGIVDSEGNEILENEYDDIYMPSPDVLRIKYQGEWYEVERALKGEISLPENSQKINVDGNELKITKVITDTGIISGYGALTAADYLLKLITSISPAYEDTIDELMFSQGAETVNIFFKLGWLPKFPFTYMKKYFENLRHPYNGPLSDIREDVIKQLKN